MAEDKRLKKPGPQETSTGALEDILRLARGEPTEADQEVLSELRSRQATIIGKIRALDEEPLLTPERQSVLNRRSRKMLRRLEKVFGDEGLESRLKNKIRSGLVNDLVRLQESARAIQSPDGTAKKIQAKLIEEQFEFRDRGRREQVMNALRESHAAGQFPGTSFDASMAEAYIETGSSAYANPIVSPDQAEERLKLTQALNIGKAFADQPALLDRLDGILTPDQMTLARSTAVSGAAGKAAEREAKKKPFLISRTGRRFAGADPFGELLKDFRVERVKAFQKLVGPVTREGFSEFFGGAEFTAGLRDVAEHPAEWVKAGQEAFRTMAGGTSGRALIQLLAAEEENRDLIPLLREIEEPAADDPRAQISSAAARAVEILNAREGKAGGGTGDAE